MNSTWTSSDRAAGPGRQGRGADRGILRPMRSIADDLRRESARRVLEMPPAERLELALRLGDDDVALLCAARGISDADARLAFARARQHGRRVSRSACP